MLNPLAHPAFASLGLRPLLVPMVNVVPRQARLAGPGIGEVVPGLVEVEVAVPRPRPALR